MPVEKITVRPSGVHAGLVFQADRVFSRLTSPAGVRSFERGSTYRSEALHDVRRLNASVEGLISASAGIAAVSSDLNRRSAAGGVAVVQLERRDEPSGWMFQI